MPIPERPAGARRRDWWLLAERIALVGSLVIMAVYLRDSYRRGEPASSRQEVAVSAERWTEAVALSSALNAAAPETVLVVSDYRCPGCARYEKVVEELADDTGFHVRILHLPLPQHPDADELALMALCAEAEAEFREMHRGLFATASPESTGENGPAVPPGPALKPDCDSDGSLRRRLDASIAWAQGVGVRATPTVFAGRYRLGALPSADALRERARRR